jgi:hypothetical protein
MVLASSADKGQPRVASGCKPPSKNGTARVQLQTGQRHATIAFVAVRSREGLFEYVTVTHFLMSLLD